MRPASDIEMLADAPGTCSACAAPLCLRKQLINLALGNDEDMQCLRCLAAEAETSESELLTRISEYICGRECLQKHWIKYETVAHCPDPDGCIPQVCFAQGSRPNG